ncbi:MAG TPA: hypothetical protein VJH88_00575 [Candidatus Nanoarchaeia archaeon]|nr:hypothetical protein [Candidatus Nanoarchaeia archaeon]
MADKLPDGLHGWPPYIGRAAWKGVKLALAEIRRGEHLDISDSVLRAMAGITSLLAEASTSEVGLEVYFTGPPELLPNKWKDIADCAPYATDRRYNRQPTLSFSFTEDDTFLERIYTTVLETRDDHLRFSLYKVHLLLRGNVGQDFLVVPSFAHRATQLLIRKPLVPIIDPIEVSSFQYSRAQAEQRYADVIQNMRGT